MDSDFNVSTDVRCASDDAPIEYIEIELATDSPGEAEDHQFAKTLEDAPSGGVTAFSSVVDVEPHAFVTLQDVADTIEQSLKDETEKARAFLSTGDRDRYNAIKCRDIISVAWAGAFSRRRSGCWHSASGLVAIDVDRLDDTMNLQALKEKVFESSWVALIAETLSGAGLRIIVNAGVRDPDPSRYEAGWAAATRWLRESFALEADQAAADYTRTSALCHDPHVLYRLDSTPFPDDVSWRTCAVASEASVTPVNAEQVSDKTNKKDSFRGRRVDFGSVNRAILTRGAADVLSKLMPDGVQRGDDFVALNPTRDDKSHGSFKIHLQTGRWKDWATDDSGGDFVSLFGYLKGIESQAAAAREFCREFELDVGGEHDQFERDEGGTILRTIQNYRVAISILGVHLSYDELGMSEQIDGLEGFGPRVNDAALRCLFFRCEEILGFLPTFKTFSDLVLDECRKHRVHPVKSYLEKITWDGVSRLDTWLSRYAEASDTELNRSVGSKFMIAAVRRINHPGTKFDTMLVLEGEQGTCKSSLLRTLAVNESWFSDSLPLNADSKVIIEQTSGKWIIEACELQGLRKSDSEALKAMLSRSVDRARLAYGRLTEEVPRSCVFAGTTNSAEYLRDPTGHRRFWPVSTGRIDLEALLEDRDQLWAEAVHRERIGESITLPPELWNEAAQVQGAREIADPWLDRLGELLEGLVGRISTVNLFEALGVDLAKANQADKGRVGAAMKRLGWAKSRRKSWKGSYWYHRGDEAALTRVLVPVRSVARPYACTALRVECEGASLPAEPSELSTSGEGLSLTTEEAQRLLDPDS